MPKSAAQASLFDDPARQEDGAEPATPDATRGHQDSAPRDRARAARRAAPHAGDAPPVVRPAPAAPALQTLAARLPRGLHLGTSSWHFPGWAGIVWDGQHPESLLARHGLSAYGAHPLLRTVSLDRTFYRPLDAAQYAHYASQVSPDFRFIVKAPSQTCSARLRASGGRGQRENPDFLNPELAIREFVAPALEGLGERLGALVFQISPLPRHLLADIPALIERIGSLLSALPRLAPTAPDAVVALEVRDAAFLSAANAPLLARTLRAARQASGNPVTYCLGLHASMPLIEHQLPLLRALWPGPLVCRWNLHRRHGAHGYEDAKAHYAPFDRIQDADPETRAHLARVIAGTCGAGFPAYLSINNKAEGSAPLSVVELAKAVARTP